MSIVVLEQPSLTFLFIFSSRIKLRNVKMWPRLGNLEPPCHCKVITQNMPAVCGEGGVDCCSALSVLIPCFLELFFEVMGAFLWEIKSITAGSERPGWVHHRRALQAESRETGRCCRWWNPHTFCFFSIQYLSAHLTSGIRAKHLLGVNKGPSGLNKACSLPAKSLGFNKCSRMN